MSALRAATAESECSVQGPLWAVRTSQDGKSRADAALHPMAVVSPSYWMLHHAPMSTLRDVDKIVTKSNRVKPGFVAQDFQCLSAHRRP